MLDEGSGLRDEKAIALVRLSGVRASSVNPPVIVFSVKHGPKP